MLRVMLDSACQRDNWVRHKSCVLTCDHVFFYH